MKGGGKRYIKKGAGQISHETNQPVETVKKEGEATDQELIKGTGVADMKVEKNCGPRRQRGTIKKKNSETGKTNAKQRGCV